jgi:hypothetical protein
MTKTKPSNESFPEEVVMNQIYYLRDQKVMLDRDLKELRLKTKTFEVF